MLRRSFAGPGRSSWFSEYYKAGRHALGANKSAAVRQHCPHQVFKRYGSARLGPASLTNSLYGLSHTVMNSFSSEFCSRPQSSRRGLSLKPSFRGVWNDGSRRKIPLLSWHGPGTVRRGLFLLALFSLLVAGPSAQLSAGSLARIELAAFTDHRPVSVHPTAPSAPLRCGWRKSGTPPG